MAQVIEFPSGAERSATILREGPMTMELMVATRIRELREERGWGKARLSKESGVSARTISRLESGEYLPHQETIKRLAKAFGVDPGVLTGEKPKPAIAGHPTAPSAEPTYPFPVRVHPAIRNAYELAARRYRVSVPTIARLAPLLFVILAEASLSHRDTTADKCRRKFEEYSEATSQLPYGIPLYDFDEEAQWERKSIEDKDVFGGQLPDAGGDGWDSANPFARYLEEVAKKYAPGDVTIDAIGPTSANYRVCRLAALALAGGEQELADSLLNGEVLIHKMLRGLTREQRVARMSELKVSGREIEEEISYDVPDKLPKYPEALEI